MKCTLVSPFGVASGSIPGGTHYVEGGIRIEPLSDTHKLRIVEYLDEIGREDLSQMVRKRPVYVVPTTDFSLPSKFTTDSLAEFLANLHRFALELFTDGRIPVAAFYFDGERVVDHAFEKGEVLQNDFKGVVVENDDWESHQLFLQFLYQRVRSSASAGLAIKRLCRAVRYGPTPDGIIDLAIALECLVGAQSEIKFQFALNHALATEDLPQERLERFQILQTLYDVRSKVVHGGEFGKAELRKLESVRDNWTVLVKICRNSITYNIYFCSMNGSEKWREHLQMLALGESRLGVEG